MKNSDNGQRRALLNRRSRKAMMVAAAIATVGTIGGVSLNAFAATISSHVMIVGSSIRTGVAGVIVSSGDGRSACVAVQPGVDATIPFAVKNLQTIAFDLYSDAACENFLESHARNTPDDPAMLGDSWRVSF